jgi:8-oxo-dGTP diphosphatase
MQNLSLVYGTSNPAKLASMRKARAPLIINIIGLKDTGIEPPDADESGSTPLENARTKALAYYAALKRPVFACDSGLYIQGLPEHEQPGIHVRMRNGARMNDDEMIEHYAAIAARLGGKAVARYSNAICLIMGDSEIYEHFGDDISYDPFYIADTPHLKRVAGFPIDSLSVNIKTGNYYYDEVDFIEDVGIAPDGFRGFFVRALNFI